MPTELKKYEAMSKEEFAALPWEEQLKYWPWLAKDIDKDAKEYADHLDSYDPLESRPQGPASTSNTPQEVEWFVMNARRMPYYLDGDDAWKALSIVYPLRDIDGQQKAEYARGVKYLEYLQKDTGAGHIWPDVLAINNTMRMIKVISDPEPKTSKYGHAQMSYTGLFHVVDPSTGVDNGTTQTDRITSTLVEIQNPLTATTDTWWF